MSDLTLQKYPAMELWLGLFAIAAMLAYTVAGVWKRRMATQDLHSKEPLTGEIVEKEPYHFIAPLPDFDWRNTEPLKFRPFKPKYHLTMGEQVPWLQANVRDRSLLLLYQNYRTCKVSDTNSAITNSTISDLIEIDKTYLFRIALRRQIMQDQHSIVLQAAPSIKPAVDEFYVWLVSVYLPKRFPTMFILKATTLLNQATSESIPLNPLADPIKALEILGGNIDDDFLFLLPSDDGDGYVLKGFVTCFPAGFNTKDKMGLKLRDIHKPVPGYKEKLEKSMDRFFDKIEVGRVVLRTNVSCLFFGKLDDCHGSG